MSDQIYFYRSNLFVQGGENEKIATIGVLNIFCRLV